MATGILAVWAILLASIGQVSALGDAKSEARAAFDRLMNALSVCDQKELVALTSPASTHISEDGQIYSGEELLKDVRARCKPAAPAVVTDVQVRTFKDQTAIITAAVEWRERGRSPKGPVRMTTVWIKQDDRWLNVHTHTSGIQTNERR